MGIATESLRKLNLPLQFLQNPSFMENRTAPNFEVDSPTQAGRSEGVFTLPLNEGGSALVPIPLWRLLLLGDTPVFKALFSCLCLQKSTKSSRYSRVRDVGVQRVEKCAR